MTVESSSEAPRPELPVDLEEALYEAWFEPPDEGFRAWLERCAEEHPEHRLALQAHAAAIATGDACLQQVQQPLAETPLPERIGSYRILELLGQGGFGTVYRAEQHEPVRRDVALKVLHPDRSDERSRLRFSLEWQTLARMQHPSIAQIYDAGQSDGGLLYFVMEYVDGEPITAWCDRNRLGLEGRIRLFLDTCGGVQHAHQKGVVHRDLKPSNVMVTTAAGEPSVKVIDFGVAKVLLDAEAAPVRTAEGGFVGTPAYMSPEQASGGQVDTRTDVYALGVLLFELLSGALPLAATRTGRSSPLELARLICEEEPVPLAQAASEADGGVGAVAKARAIPPELLRRRLRSDVAWIVRRALAKSPDQRYGSVAELAADVERFLQAQPVMAREQAAVYLVRRFIARHRLGVGVTLATLLVTVAGVVGLLWSLGQVERARREAVVRREEAVVNGYSAHLAAASGALEIGNVADALHHLRQAPAEHRGWEWDYLFSQCDQSLRCVDLGQTVQRVAWLDKDRLFLLLGDSSGMVWIRGEPAPQQVFAAMGPEGDDMLWSREHRLLVLDCRTDLWQVDPVTFELRHLRRNGLPSGDVRSMACSRDGEELFVSDNSGAILGIDLATRRERWIAQAPKYAWDLETLPGGRLAAGLGTLEGRIHTYDTDAGELLWDRQVHEHPVVSLRAHRGDGPVLFAAARNRLLALDADDGSLLSATGITASVTGMEVTSDGQTLVGIGVKASPTLWRCDTLEMLHRYHGHTEGSHGLALHPGGALMATGSFDGTVRTWSLARPQRPVELPAGVRVMDLAVSTGGEAFAAVDFRGQVTVWDAETLEPVLDQQLEHNLLGCALTPEQVLVTGRGIFALQRDGVGGEALSGDTPHWVSGECPDGVGDAESNRVLGRCLLDPGGRWLVGASVPAAELYLWSMPDLRLVYRGEHLVADRFCWDDSSGCFVVGHREGGLVWFDPTARKIVRREPSPPMCWSLGIHKGLVAGGNGTLMFRPAAGEPFLDLGLTNTLSAVAVHPSGERLFCSGHEPLVRILDRDGHELLVLDDLMKPVIRFGFLLGGRRVVGLTALPGDRGSVIVWTPGR